MTKQNQMFYKAQDLSISSQNDSDFETIASRKSDRENLAYMMMFFAFLSWQSSGKPEKFDFAEIGAGEGDLTREFLRITKDFKEQEDDRDLKKFAESINFSILDLPDMAPKWFDLTENVKIKHLISSRPDFPISKPSGAEVEKKTKELGKY